MSPEQFRKARAKLGYSAAQMARALRVASGRTVRRWESGEREVPGPVTVALDYMLAAVPKKTKK